MFIVQPVFKQYKPLARSFSGPSAMHETKRYITLLKRLSVNLVVFDENGNVYSSDRWITEN